MSIPVFRPAGPARAATRPGTFGRRIVRLPVLRTAAVLLTCVVLSACGGAKTETKSSGGSGEIASLVTSSPTNSASGGQKAADTGRPQLRLDMSEEEEERLWTLYNICLRDHGVAVIRRGEGEPGAVNPDGSLNPLSMDQSGEPKEAYVACANKLPLQPPELDPDKNPEYADQWNDYIRCLRGRGIKMHATSPGNATWDDDVNDDPGAPQLDLAKIEKECTLEVFGGKK
ncbi:hypothetical protein ACI2K4_21035 [Micromonospora sp. NPDC050397]|uniref:hypothetical protein n=1 Tax=Micromonospora sp. NPDC050397 TaxID=3364279 RepID=UPI00384B572D